MSTVVILLRIVQVFWEWIIIFGLMPTWKCDTIIEFIYYVYELIFNSHVSMPELDPQYGGKRRAAPIQLYMLLFLDIVKIPLSYRWWKQSTQTPCHKM